VKNDLNGKDNTALTKLIQPTQKAAPAEEYVSFIFQKEEAE
jgi:hypothetical protein